MTGSDQGRVVFVEIEGTVWWSSDTAGRVILKDDTAVVQLELDLPCPKLRLGDRLNLEGDCTVVKTRGVIKIASVPVVENNGLHAVTEQSGRIHLKAGLHPIQVAWFNRTDQYSLQVEYEGPGRKRQKIPDSALFHAQTDSATGSTNFINGLKYRNCEGQWWNLLPNFDHIAAEKTGVTGNFDIEVRSRNDHVGLQFTGLIEVPSEGDYTFYVRSDDGSRLFVGEGSLRARTNGSTELPTTHPVIKEVVSATKSEYQWSEIEGIVTSVHRSQGILEVELITEPGLVRLKVAVDSEGSFALKSQNRIRAVGVSRRIRNQNGRWIRGEFFVQRWEDIEQRYISPMLWTEYPVMKIENLMKNADQYAGSVVHLRGRVESTGEGEQSVLEDGSGRVIMAAEVPETYTNRLLDVLGRLSLKGSRLLLKGPLYRQIGSESGEADNLPLLTTIEQIYQLSLKESARRYPVKIRGVITSPMVFAGTVLQDSSQGIYVALDFSVDLQIGDYCEIEGVTGPYEFSQYIDATRVEVLGGGGLPDPVEPSWDQLINGSLHCNYVELEGVVTSIGSDMVSLLTRGGRINVRLNSAGPAIPHDALGATVRLRGCLFTDWDLASRRVLVGSIYLDQHWVAVAHPAPIDPFAIELKRVGDLLQFDPQAGALQRVMVSGVLIHKGKDFCCLMDGSNGLKYVPIKEMDAVFGDRVDVVGFLELSGPSPVLRVAIARKTGRSEIPVPIRLEPKNLLQDEYDSTFTRVDGVLLGISEQPDKVVLELQNGLRRFTAELTGEFDVKAWVPGSRLELTGAYIGQGGNRVLGQPINAFKLLLNSDADIAVLSHPPWWTLQRMFSVVGLLAAVLVAALIWIKLLRRKVGQRTEELGNQIRERQRAEHQREFEQERTRLAHDLHDDLGARLTEVNMLASLIESSDTTTEERKKYADELSDIALHMVTSLDEIVWAVNPRNDTVSSLAGYFGAYAQRLLELASIHCGLDVADCLPHYSLDSRFRQEIFLAFKEALANIIQHAQAEKVWLRIFLQDHDLVVIISDDGAGFIPGEREAGADGLINMQERLGALNGQCTIQSDPETGTIVHLQAPIQRDLE